MDDLDEPCRRYSLQENGRYFVQQPVCEDTEYIGVDPRSYEGYTPARSVHKHEGTKAQRKFSLDEYSRMHPVSMAGMPQLQSMYPMPSMSYPLHMAGTMRPVQEVQPICLERSQKVSPQSLHMKTVKRRHLIKAQKSQSQGYYPQGYPGGAMYMNQHEGMYMNQPEMQPSHQNKVKQQLQLSPPMPVQSMQNVYGYPELQASGKVHPQSYGSVQSQMTSGNMAGIPGMQGLSPVQMVHPIQQYQPVSTTSPVQLVPIQGMPGTSMPGMPGMQGTGRYAMRSGSLDDDVFMAYRPYQVAYPASDDDDDSDSEESNYSLPMHHSNIQQEYDPYLSVRSAPGSCTEVASIIKASSDSTKKQKTARRVSFEDEVLEERRKRSYSSPPDTIQNDNYNSPGECKKDISTNENHRHMDTSCTQTLSTDEWDGYEDDDAYLKMRQRYAARKSNSTPAPTQVSPTPPPTAEPSEDSLPPTTEDDDTDSYEGIKRLPRIKSALKSSREKQDLEEEEEKENKLRRKSVPAKIKMAQETEPTKKGRRNSICPMTAYNLRGSSTVAIDNKIEQAMDLVKSHLMFAVREEVEVLREQIAELIERNNQLEYENGILRAAASPETLAKLAPPRQQPPPPSSTSS